MRLLSGHLLVASLLLCVAPAFGADVIPVQPVTAPRAPLQFATHTLVGAEFGWPIGVGAYVMTRANPNLSFGAFVSEARHEFNDDPLKVRHYGLRTRLHWGGLAPRGGYLFAEVFQARSKFEKSAEETGRTSATEVPDGWYGAFGVGHQVRSEHVSFDFGGGYGAAEKFYVEHRRGLSSDRSDAELGGFFYLGLAFGI